MMNKAGQLEGSVCLSVVKGAHSMITEGGEEAVP